MTEKTNAQVALEAAALVCQRVSHTSTMSSGSSVPPNVVISVADKFLDWLRSKED